MKQEVKDALFKSVETEPFCQLLGIRLVSLDDGHSVVEMEYQPERMNNIYQRAHGGAVFALIDEAFETSCQTEGTINVALNVNVTYVSSPEPGLLRCESIRAAKTKKTATFDIQVTDSGGAKIAICQALAYNTGKPIPFL